MKAQDQAIPVVIRALRMTKKGTQNSIDQISGKPSLREMQDIALTSITHRL